MSMLERAARGLFGRRAVTAPLEVNMAEMMQSVQFRVRVPRTLRLRMWVGLQIIRIGVKVVGAGMQIDRD